MRICTKNRWLSIAVAVGYALTITTASLFHNHADPGGRCCHGQSLAHAASEACHHGESGGEAPRQNSSQTPTPCPSDGGHCSVCHFLGHKPAPVAEVVPVVAGAGARGCRAGAGAHRRRRLLGLAEPRAADLRVISSRSLWFFPGCSCAPCASNAFGTARAGRHLCLETTRCWQSTVVRSRDSNGKQQVCHCLPASSAECLLTDGTASAKQWHMVSELAGMKQQIGPAHRLAAWTRRLNGDFQSLIPNP